MPIVPGLVPEIAPSSGGSPEINVSAPAEAFGGLVGQATAHLGNTIDAASDKIWERAVQLQNLNNDTEAKRADTDYMIKTSQMRADFLTKEGDNARAAYPQYMKDLQATRESIRGGLSNPMSQKMYDASSMSFMGREIFNGAAHAGQQTKVAAKNASEARVQTLTDNIGEHPEDENEYNRNARAIAAEVRSQGQQGGWSEDQVRATTDSRLSDATAKRITGLARTDPFAAKSMFDTAAKAGTINPNDASRVEATIQTQSRQVVSRNISSEVNADLQHAAPEGVPEKSLEDRIVEAKADPRVQKFAKNDPLLPDFVEQRVIADFNRSKAIQRDADNRNNQTVAAAMMTGNKEGILPKSVDELRLINPDVGQAWDALKPTQQKKYMATFAQNAKGETVAWNQDNLRTYQTIKGQAIDNPVEFLARDVISEKIPDSAKKELINQQLRMKAQSQSDPRVGRAMQILAPDLASAGIDKKKDTDGYYHFVGSLADALDAYQTDNKKVPPAEEVKKIGARLMQEQHTHWWQTSQKFVDQPVPDDEADKLKADSYWKANGITPNDDMIRRIYVANKYNELYRGSKKTTPGNPQ